MPVANFLQDTLMQHSAIQPYRWISSIMNWSIVIASNISERAIETRIVCALIDHKPQTFIKTPAFQKCEKNGVISE
jgi:hypothetical protein